MLGHIFLSSLVFLLVNAQYGYCPAGQYWDARLNICCECPAVANCNQRTCSGPNQVTCVSCTQGYVLDNNQCVVPRPDCGPRQYYEQASNTCRQCTQLPNCVGERCSGPYASTCRKCEDGYFLFTDTQCRPIPTCRTDQWLNNYVCQDCPAIGFCADRTCTNGAGSTCNRCQGGYNLKNNACELNRPDCQPGQYLFYNPSGPSYQCHQCAARDGCARVTCNDQYSSQCVQCNDGYLSILGACIRQPPPPPPIVPRPPDNYRPPNNNYQPPSNNYDRPNRPDNNYDRPNRPDNNYDRPNRPDNNYDRPNRPDNNYDRPNRPDNNYDRPNRPDNNYDRPNRPDNNYDRPNRPANNYNNNNNNYNNNRGGGGGYRYATETDSATETNTVVNGDTTVVTSTSDSGDSYKGFAIAVGVFAAVVVALLVILVVVIATRPQQSETV